LVTRSALIVCLLILLIFFLSESAFAGEADVVDVTIQRQADGTYTFSVTVRHADEGWKHYADRWEVMTLDGSVLGSRELLHPHVGEQPFTRSLAGVKIPEVNEKVIVRARDSVHNYGGKEMEVKLPGR
jgi:hypothetical protein